MPCATLDKIQESLNDDINFDALRNGLNQGLGPLRARQSTDAVQSLSHGVYYMSDVDTQSPVPGLAPLLQQLRGAVDDVGNAVRALTIFSGGYDGVTRFPTQDTWEAVDYAENKVAPVQNLVNRLRPHCS